MAKLTPGDVIGKALDNELKKYHAQVTRVNEASGRAADKLTQKLRATAPKRKGKYADILFFKLGFAPWFLLCILVFPAFYVIPYYKQSITCFFLSR